MRPYVKRWEGCLKQLARRVAVCLLHISFTAALLADEASRLPGSMDPMRPLLVLTAPVIDGKLDDAIWRQAPYVTGFRSFIPDFGKAIPESTVVYMAYDRENLYFAFRCFDPTPSLIKAELTNRDNIRPHDFVCVNLDSFNDQQALYTFYVNPLGIQSDARYAAGNEDFSVDFVWYSAGEITGEGYAVEIQIPLNSIRYSDKNPVEMALIFERRVSRRSEHVSYPSLDPNKGYQFLTQMQPIVYPDLDPYRLFELLPAFTYSQKYLAPQGELVRDLDQGEASITVKYGITSNLTLDGTYNPDFSQVEADAGQVDVNLRYGLFFPEKRPFFLEGAEIFNLSATGNAQVVHTRTIVNPLAGVKLSGKIGERSTLAAIYAVDELLDAQSRLTGEKAVFPIFRYKYALGNDSYVGGIYTGRELTSSWNRVGGVDGFQRISTSGYVEYQALVSETETSSDAPVMEGYALATYYRNETRDLDLQFGATKLSDGFRADAGYVTRTGIVSVNGLVRPKIYPDSELLRRITLTLFSEQTRDDLSARWETYNSLALGAVLVGALSASASYIYSTEMFLANRYDTGGFTFGGGGQFTKELNVNLSYRNTKAIYFSSAPFQGRTSRATAAIVFQPWYQLEANVSLTYVDFHRESDGQKVYEYPITRGRLTYQLNQYLFFRGIAEYNKFRRTLLSDYLVSFTYIPGTVLHAGYGSLYQRLKWENSTYIHADDFLEMQRGLFFKMSYLWRL